MTMTLMTRNPRRAAPPMPDQTEYQPVDWKRLFFRPKYLFWWVIAFVVIVLTILVSIHHDDVVKYLRPFSEHVRDLPAGWLIPIAILVIISFPPLFGHEIVALLCGVVYGLWIGFGIVAAGTFIGELGTWFAFQYLLRRKAEKLERTNLNYGALARLTRDGGFWIVLVIRFSAIPSHFCTAVFSTCGVNFWFFAIATFLTLPKQIFLVYLGVVLIEPHHNNTIKNAVFGVAFAVTVLLAVFIWFKMRTIKRMLLEEQAERKRKQLEALQTKPDEALNPTSGVDFENRDEQWLLIGQSRAEDEYDVFSREEHGVEYIVLTETRTPIAIDAKSLSDISLQSPELEAKERELTRNHRG